MMPMPAQSAKLQLVNGNKGKQAKSELERRVENEEKLKMSADNINPPSWLSATAKKEFKRVAQLLIEVELISEADITFVALYADAYAQYISYDKQIRKNGISIGGKPNPFIKKKQEAAQQIKSFANELGLSPASRAKLAINLSNEEDDELDF